MELNQIEARVIGCLLEKEITTPEQYPLSLNALSQACNQKTSREPVMSLSDTEVQQTLDDLNKKRLISEQSGFGSRVVKYKHRFCNTEFSELQLSSAELAIIDLLLLRGPQTPGELRTRGSRLHEFQDIAEVDLTLTALANRDKPLVKQLAREPGKREARFTECFSLAGQNQESVVSFSSAILAEQAQPVSNTDAVSKLEQRVAQLESEVNTLKTQLSELLATGKNNE